MVTDFPTLEGFDPLSEEFLSDPFPILERARREVPVFYYPPMGFWVVTRRDDIIRVVNDFETFSSRAAGMVELPEELVGKVPANLFDNAFIGIDPPSHTVDRKHANKAFTRGRVAALADDIRAMAHELIDGFEADGKTDLMQDYCYELSLRTIVRLLGMNPADIPKYRQWSVDMISLLAPVDANDPDAVPTKPISDEERHERWSRLAEAYAYYTKVVEERMDDDRGDLVSAMIRVVDEDGNPAISRDRLIMHIQELIVAGNETTAGLMGQIVIFLNEEPGQKAEILHDPSLLEKAVEEGLRRRGPATGLFRITTRDVEIGGTTIPARSPVYVVFASAGHDESLFPDPRRFDLHRENADKHLSFGRGRHMCMGAPLARLEARIGLEVLYERLPQIRVVPDQKLTYQPVFGMMLNHLHVDWPLGD